MNMDIVKAKDADITLGTHRKICRKLSLLKEATAYVKRTEPDNEALRVNELEQLSHDYYFAMIPMMNSNSDYADMSKYEMLMSVCKSHNILQRIVAYLKHIKEFDIKNCRSLVQECENIGVTFENAPPKIDLCDECNCRVYIETSLLQAICSGCGKCSKIIDTAFDFDNAPVHHLKTSSIPHNKHSFNWLMRIQAKKSIALSKETLERIRGCLEKNYTRPQRTYKGNIIQRLRNIKNVKCTEFRPWLRELGLASLNPDIPYIRKVICGVYPYQLIHMEEQRILYIHSLAIEAYKELYSDEAKKKNNPYVPYMLGKIIESIFAENTKENNQKKTLLECIHIQGEDTTMDRDNKWKLICVKIKVVDYYPTIGSRYDRLK